MSEINFCNTKEQLNHLGEVVTGKTNGSPSGADIDKSTLPYTGQVRKTLPALEAEFQGEIDSLEARGDAVIEKAEQDFAIQRDQFDATFQSQFAYKRIGNISDYAGQQLPEVEKLNSYQYPDDSGEWYGPIQDQAFPITIPANPSTSTSWALVNALTTYSLSNYSEILYKSSVSGSAIENMLSDLNANPLMYAIGTQIKTGNTSWVYEDSTGAITLENFRAFNALCTTDFGADPKGINASSDAIQSAIYAAGSAATHSNEVWSPAGRYKLDKPLMFYQKDGIRFTGDGKWATIFESSGDMTPVLDSDFQSIEGVYNGYTYSDKKCFIMVAARRVTGGLDGKVNPNGANSAAWFNYFEGFSMLCPEETDLLNTTISGFWCPEIAHSTWKDIYCQYVYEGLRSINFYRNRMEQIDIANCYRPLNLQGGTTNDLQSIGSSRSIKGYHFKGMNYSSLNNIACDNWAFGQVNGSLQDCYAYEFIDCLSVTMTGGGAENGRGGLLRIYGERFNVRFDSCTFSGGVGLNNDDAADFTDISDFGVTEFSYIRGVDPGSRAPYVTAAFNGCVIRQEYWTDPIGDPNSQVKMPMIVDTGSKVTVDNLGDAYASRVYELIPETDSTSELNIINSSERAYTHLYRDTTQAGSGTPSNGIYVEFDEVKEDTYECMVDSSTWRAKYGGMYTFNAGISLTTTSGDSPRYVGLVIDGVENPVVNLDSSKVYNRDSQGFSFTHYISAGSDVRVFLRVDNPIGATIDNATYMTVSQV